MIKQTIMTQEEIMLSYQGYKYLAKDVFINALQKMTMLDICKLYPSEVFIVKGLKRECFLQTGSILQARVRTIHKGTEEEMWEYLENSHARIFAIKVRPDLF
jgi:hypothetical protein